VIEESLIDAPAAMVIITSDDIKQQGYSSLNEVLMDFTGVDISVKSEYCIGSEFVLTIPLKIKKDI